MLNLETLYLLAGLAVVQLDDDFDVADPVAQLESVTIDESDMLQPLNVFLLSDMVDG